MMPWWDVAQSIKAMITLLNEMHVLGQAAPTSEQFRVNGTMAIRTTLQELPQLWIPIGTRPEEKVQGPLR
jgi:hypothetical protein